MIDSFLMLLAVLVLLLFAFLAPVDVKMDEPAADGDDENVSEEALPAAA